MADPIVITGGDPANPRRAAHIVERLEQVELDTMAMALEVARLEIFAGRIRDVLLDQGVRPGSAQERADAITSRLRKVRATLEEVGTACENACGAIDVSGVNQRTSFEWRPGVPGRR